MLNTEHCESNLGPQQTEAYWSLPKEYVSIKNTKQPLLVFIVGTFYPRMQEAVKKTTSELLSAVLKLIVRGVCVLLKGYLVYTVHCTVG